MRDYLEEQAYWELIKRERDEEDYRRHLKSEEWRKETEIEETKELLAEYLNSNEDLAKILEETMERTMAESKTFNLHVNTLMDEAFYEYDLYDIVEEMDFKLIPKVEVTWTVK